MENEPQEPRTSLWSVPGRWAGVYLWLFGSQSVSWLILLIVREVSRPEAVIIVNQVVNVGIAWAPLMVVSAGVSMLLVEGAMVFAEAYLNHRYTEGRKVGIIEGRQEGREEGIEIGIDRGARDERTRWISERARWEEYRDQVEEAHRLGNPPPAPPTASENGHRRQ